jgi:polysaccharide pyruvyl transferase WcaK-like protein
MNKVKILHVASYTGNIGDNASHIGLTNILHRILGDGFEIERLEIRRFYKSYSLPDKLSFDKDFVEYANKKDFLIVGGGGFFDYWVPNSRTGTTIDISEEALSKLSVPSLFVSVGSMPHQLVPEGNIDKFHRFLQQLSNKKNVRVAVRNDGSKREINRLFAGEFDGWINEILDNAFFYEPDPSVSCLVSPKPYIAVNTTLDQLSMHNKIIGKIDYESFKKEFVSLLQRIIDQTDYNIVFVPHIFKDLQAFREILQGINDFYIRSRVIVAPYVQGEYGCNLLMSVYNNASAVVGMRFHANVCPVAMGKKVIGLAALDRIIHMYDSIGMGDNVVLANGDFSSAVYDRISKTLVNDNTRSVADRKEKTKEIYIGYLKGLGLI